MFQARWRESADGLAEETEFAGKQTGNIDGKVRRCEDQR